MSARLRWALRTARYAAPETLAARLRLLWHDFVIHALLNRGHERCQDCGRRTGGWHTSNEHWLRVVGSPSGLLCLPCFDARSLKSASGQAPSSSQWVAPCLSETETAGGSSVRVEER
jgi:hypothetical protein